MADVTSVANADLSGIAGSVGNALKGAGVWIAVIFIVLVIFGLGLFIWWLLSFNIVCFVEERLNHGTFATVRKAKIIYEKNKDGNNRIERLQIFGQKRQIMFPQHSKELGENVQEGTIKFNLFGVTKKGKMALRMIKEGDEFTIIPFLNEDVGEYLRVTRPVRQQWANNLLREGMELFAPETTFWEKYGSMIMMGSTMIVILVIFIVLFGKMDKLEMMANSIDNYADAVNNFAQAIRETAVQQVV